MLYIAIVNDFYKIKLMKTGRMWLFIASLLIWFAILALLIYAIVYAPLTSSFKPYTFVIGLSFICFTQIVKKAFKFASSSDRRY